MKKRLKYISAIFFLAIFCLLSGCTPSYFLIVHIEGEMPADTYLEMLIPIDDDDEYYVSPENSTAWKSVYNADTDDEGQIKEFTTSEIATYDLDGFRSAAFHCRLMTYEQIGENMTFEFDSESDVTEFCNRYEKFRFAVVDKYGNVLGYTAETPLISSRDYHLAANTTYDASTNTIAPKYEGYNSDFAYVFFVLTATVMLIPTAAILLIYIISYIIARLMKKPKCVTTALIYAIIFGSLGLPSFFGTFFGIIDSFMATLTISDGLSDILTKLPIFMLILIPCYISSCFVLTYNSRKKLRAEKNSASVVPSEQLLPPENTPDVTLDTLPDDPTDAASDDTDDTNDLT